ncbi:hypothetical protein [Oscillatoria sp. FACHB-1406]|uniref:hypothetical protein n=1 Tax=Oscillatoria sp. FACHB-1406 TaxID=2692846 RepID=UPI001688AD51|nr:hypothetical protein [Oscillatoria sp. FACHB-1406]MBD2577487.1 hypothetical protein [Oscillatoria sp. FACHB-1406]
MVDDVERSPEILHKYFDLLKLHRTGGIVELPPELIETSESLMPINRELSLNIKLTSSIKQSIVSDENSIKLIGDNLSSVDQKIVLLDREVESIRREIESVSQEMASVREAWSSNNVSPHLLIILQLYFQELCNRLLRVIFDDLNRVLLVFTVFIMGGLLSRVIFTIAYNSIVIAFIFIYLFKQLNDIHKEYEKIERQNFVDLERNRLRLQAKQQELEKKEHELGVRQQELEEKKYELGVRQQELEVSIESCTKKLTELERIYVQLFEARQNQFDKLKDDERECKKTSLQDLEEKVKKWLDQDKATLIERARKTLLIQIGRETGELNTLQTSQPIQRLFGVSSRHVERIQDRIETDRDSNLFQRKDVKGLLISNRDFRRDCGLDGKKRYGIYEFTAIFFCANFLAYYRCYWNFIRHLTVDEEICEILYDTIVSVKVKERSSTNLKDHKLKRIYKEFLSIATMDGKIFSFRIDEDRTERTETEGSLRESQIEEAGRTIRDILRQRRIDVMRTKNADS